jgi:membrane protein DedA with SNARE-associated domain
MIGVVIAAESSATRRRRALATWTTFARPWYPDGRRDATGSRPTVCHDRSMRRPSTATFVLLVPALLHIHLHHRFHGPPFDYVGLALACFASWIGVPGPGEPLLLAAAVLAARHQLDLATVLGVAFVTAVLGGIVGWAIGLVAGRRVATARGPLRSLRVRMVERGEDIFARYPITAIIMTPSVMAGVHRVRPVVYHTVNVASAIVWTLVLGVGGYYLGSPVLDAITDVGTAFTIIVVIVIVGLLAAEVRRRYRRSYR